MPPDVSPEMYEALLERGFTRIEDEPAKGKPKRTEEQTHG